MTSILFGLGAPTAEADVVDTIGPYMVSATVLEEPNQANRILIVWDERLTSATVCPGCGTNFSIVMVGSNVTVAVSNILYNPSGGPAPNFPPITRLTVYSTNWFRGSNYYVIANRIRDLKNNVIAPNSVIGVAWPTNATTNVMDFFAAWEYHIDWNRPFNPDPTIYRQPWYAVDYDTATNGHWRGAFGIAYKDPQVDPLTFFPCQRALVSEIDSFVRNPTLFRGSFVVPASLATNVTLRVTSFADDGYVLYLNGTELPSPVGRVNAPAGVPVDENLFSTSEYPDGQCSSNNVQVVLGPGTNIVAAAVCQHATESASGGDIYFGMCLDVSQTTYRTSPVPADGSPPLLTATRLNNGNITFTWPTNIYGYALEFTTNITRVGQNTVLGPWYQAQTNMSIGMVTDYPVPISGSGPVYLFRLHKVP